jgi:hypothetical protein
MPKEQQVYIARCTTCKKAFSIKAKELVSFERVFGACEIVTTNSTFDKFFE